MFGATKLQISRVDDYTPKTWEVVANGTFIGFVQEAEINVSGSPEYFALLAPEPFWRGSAKIFPACERHPLPFVGQYGDVDAVAWLMRNTYAR